jgi:endoglucanase
MKRLSLCLIGLLVCLCATARSVAPSDDAIRMVGRFTDDFRFGWTGSLIETDFAGTTIEADLEVVEGPAAGITVVVDGAPRFLKLSKGRSRYTLADDLDAASVHRIVVFKRSEGGKGEVRFQGFEVSADGVLTLPAAPQRKMLVIGDSITCGYGNEAKSLKEGNTIENENGYMSYAPIAARTLNADLMMLCWSGRGLYRNRQLENDQAATIPKIFNQTLPLDSSIEWDHSKYVPDVIVINLGTNDMAEQKGQKAPLPKDGYMAAYKAFIARLRAYAPDSKVILSIGPMGSDPVRQWLPTIAADFEDVSVLIYSPFAGPEDKAGHHHPSVTKDVSMAAELVAEIQSETDWD